MDFPEQSAENESSIKSHEDMLRALERAKEAFAEIIQAMDNHAEEFGGREHVDEILDVLVADLKALDRDDSQPNGQSANPK